MKKIVINKEYGGFSLSPEAELWLWNHGMKEIGTPVKEYYGGSGKFAEMHPNHDWTKDYKEAVKRAKEYKKKGGRNSLMVETFVDNNQYILSSREISRDHPLLIECIKELGVKANGAHATLKIVEIPCDVDWEIAEYDGLEHIQEKHRTWG
jgi:hypothetical protein